MGNDRRIVDAARVSYGQGTKTVREDKGLINYLIKNDHNTPLEKVRFEFHVKAPIFIARQWMRHRMSSINEYSGRYSVMPDEFYEPLPASLRAQSGRNKQVGEGNLEEEIAESSSKTIERMSDITYESYEKLLEAGVCREQARIVLPVNLYTQWYWTIDLHNLLHFLKLRLDWHAQEEIRVYGQAIAQLIQPIVPLAWEAFDEHILNTTRVSNKKLEYLQSLESKINLSRPNGEDEIK
jgi:thymidylate synthase (FAD)